MPNTKCFFFFNSVSFYYAPVTFVEQYQGMRGTGRADASQMVSEPHGKVDTSPACPAPKREGGTKWASSIWSFPQCREAPLLVHGMNLGSELHHPGQFPGAMSTPGFLGALASFGSVNATRPHDIWWTLKEMHSLHYIPFVSYLGPNFTHKIHWWVKQCSF